MKELLVKNALHYQGEGKTNHQWLSLQFLKYLKIASLNRPYEYGRIKNNYR